MNAIERLRAGIGAGDRLVPGTMSQEEADALEALRAVDALYQAAKGELEANGSVEYDEGCDCPTCALAAAVRRVDGDA